MFNTPSLYAEFKVLRRPIEIACESGPYGPKRAWGLETSAFTLGFNRSMQHLDSSYREEDVADEAKIENILYRTTKSADFGSFD